MSSMDTDVVIVGGGPSGLVLGLFLAEYRVKASFGYLYQRTNSKGKASILLVDHSRER